MMKRNRGTGLLLAFAMLLALLPGMTIEASAAKVYYVGQTTTVNNIMDGHSNCRYDSCYSTGITFSDPGMVECAYKSLDEVHPMDEITFVKAGTLSITNYRTGYYYSENPANPRKHSVSVEIEVREPELIGQGIRLSSQAFCGGFPFPEINVAAGANYRVTEATIYREMVNYYPGDDLPKYAAGTELLLELTIKPNAGYIFPDNVKVRYEDEEYTASVVNANDGQKVYAYIPVTLAAGGTLGVTVTNLDAPEGYTSLDYTADLNNQAICTSVSYRKNGREVTEVYPGDTVDIVLRAEAGEGNVFFEGGKAYWNGIYSEPSTAIDRWTVEFVFEDYKVPLGDPATAVTDVEVSQDAVTITFENVPDEKYGTCEVFVAAYDEDGRMIGVSVVELDDSVVDVGLSDAGSADHINVFVTDSNDRPVTPVDTTPVHTFRFYTQPQSIEIAPGGEAKFEAEIEGGQYPYTVQWQAYGGVWADVRHVANVSIDVDEGYGISLLKTKDASLADTPMRVIFTDANGRQLISEEFRFTIKKEPLIITSQPQSVSCAVGETVTFDVGVSGGTAPYTYKWRFALGGGSYNDVMNGSNTTGQGTSQLTVKTTEGHITSNTTFICIVKDRDGNTVETNVVDLNVSTPKPLSASISFGEVEYDRRPYTCHVTGGVGPYLYRWVKKDNTFLGSTQTCWVYKNSWATDVICTVTDSTGQSVTVGHAVWF